MKEKQINKNPIHLSGFKKVLSPTSKIKYLSVEFSPSIPGPIKPIVKANLINIKIIIPIKK